MLSALIEFIHRLRDAAIPISMVEALDATQSLRHIDLSSRAELRAALEAALVKRAEHRASFAALFQSRSELGAAGQIDVPQGDRKSTRLNSSHVRTSYAVFCLEQ